MGFKVVVRQQKVGGRAKSTLDCVLQWRKIQDTVQVT